MLVPLRCGEGLTLLSPSTLLRLLAALYGACPALRADPALGCSTKARTRLRLHSVPSPPERLRQLGARPAHSPRVRVRRAFSPPRSQPQLPPGPVRCVHFLPSASPAPVPAYAGRVPAPCVSLQPSRRRMSTFRISGSLWLETGGLFAVPRGCGPWGQACPFPLPPASSLRQCWASPQPGSSSLDLLRACSANGQQCVWSG